MVCTGISTIRPVPLGNYDNQQSYVLESAGTDPMGPYTYKGRLFDPSHDTWSIDGGVLELNGSLYFLFSAFERTSVAVYRADEQSLDDQRHRVPASRSRNTTGRPQGPTSTKVRSSLYHDG